MKLLPETPKKFGVVNCLRNVSMIIVNASFVKIAVLF